MDKKVYHYAAIISGGITNGAFEKIYQEVWIQKKRILLKGYLNERYSIIQTNKKNNQTEYVCKNSRHTTYLLLLDTDHQTGVLINEHQAGILFSHDKPCSE
jgi:hypothetical protein